MAAARNSLALDVQGVGHARRVGQRLRDRVLELVGENQDARRGVVHHLDQLAPVHAPVVAGQDRAQLAAREKRVQEFHAIEGHDAHPVAFGDPGDVAQPVGEAVGALVQLGVGVMRAARLARIHHGQPVG